MSGPPPAGPARRSPEQIVVVVAATVVTLVAGLLAITSATRPVSAAGSPSTTAPPGSVERPPPPADAATTGWPDPASLIGDARRGQGLYESGCSSCHGIDGRGVDGRGPTLEGAGTASTHFYLSSGRMPAAVGTDDQALRKPPAYAPDQIADLVAYVDGFGDGEDIPFLRLDDADLALGQQLYTANCAGCHNSAGSGGALGQGFYAPAVTLATDLEVAEAARVGPGAMPAFGAGVLDDEELAAVVRYTGHLRAPEDPGGFALGRVGPVTEGLVAGLVGMVALLLGARLIGGRR
jgi:ubiquinol-cytochrome c reductase cytochrome c subunit